MRILPARPRRLVTRLILTIAGLAATSGPALFASQASPPTDLDAFMAKVLERRNENWRVLHDYILSEREQFALTAPDQQRVFGGRREFTWFVRDGYLIRSPVRFDGVELDAAARQRYEAKWLREERERETRASERAKAARDSHAREDDGEPSEAPAPATAKDAAPSGTEPRFISEAYFMRFKFDPGNYYLAGRETLDGRAVLRIEYYPTRLFGSARRDAERRPSDGGKACRDSEQDVERKLNKVALVTLWVDPAEHQIVKYTFENTDLNFLPARWLARVGDIDASMEMGQYFNRVWLPRRIGMHGSVTLASGSYDASYGREFFDYRHGEVKARIRSYSVQER